jgi:Uma2 family endonuclease
MIADKTRITYAEFERLIEQPEYADRSIELIEGRMVEKMPNEEHGSLIFLLGGKLLIFAKEKQSWYRHYRCLASCGG